MESGAAIILTWRKEDLCETCHAHLLDMIRITRKAWYAVGITSTLRVEDGVHVLTPGEVEGADRIFLASVMHSMREYVQGSTIKHRVARQVRDFENRTRGEMEALGVPECEDMPGNSEVEEEADQKLLH